MLSFSSLKAGILSCAVTKFTIRPAHHTSGSLTDPCCCLQSATTFRKPMTFTLHIPLGQQIHSNQNLELPNQQPEPTPQSSMEQSCITSIVTRDTADVSKHSRYRCSRACYHQGPDYISLPSQAKTRASSSKSKISCVNLSIPT